MYLRTYEYPYRHRYRFKVIGFKGHRSKLLHKEKAEAAEYLFKLDNSLSRSRRLIRDYILCNRFTMFCTFTFSAAKIDRMDLEACKKAITHFFNNFKSRYAPDFTYLIVPEQHQDGAWHFHGMVRGIPEQEFIVPQTIQVRDKKTNELRTVPNTKGYVRWERYSKRFGHFDCSKIRHYEACATYVSKYITKGLSDLTKSKRLFFASQNLNKPDLVLDQDGIPFTYKPDYEDQWCQMAWLTSRQTIGTLLPEWYGDCCSDLREVDPQGTADRGELESLLFEPYTFEQLKLEYLERVTRADSTGAPIADAAAQGMSYRKVIV